jgi:acyl-CoA synthetase (AMP-forming)/AMP-acid ligase II/thioesterase domain-containing protein/acyl carrier protein
VTVREPNDFWTMFSTLARTVGDVEAILAPGRTSLRFSELPSRFEAIRAALNRFGIGRGDRVAIVVPRGPEMAVCYLGVAACATSVPLNPDYSEDEFHRYLQRLGPKCVIVRQEYGDGVRRAAAKLGISVVELIPRESGTAGLFGLEGEASERPAAPEWAGEEDVALILLTSGTTSSGKLVPLRHRNILAFARGMKAAFGIGPSDRTLQVMPMFHGHGLLTSIACPLANGGGVICPTSVDVASIFSHMQALRPTWLSAAYTILQSILDQIDGYRVIAKGAHLRFISAGSGRLDPRVGRALESEFGAPVVPRYSTSETGGLTFNPLPPRIRKPRTVGIPMYNEVRTIDESGAVLGPDQAGEVVARGPGVIDGYLDDPEANAAGFINGWFRTGDLGYFDADGYLTLTGRIKDLINRGGEKIGPPEVESVLAGHPAVRQVCVFGIPHPSLGEEVAAAVVPAAGEPASEEAIRKFARARLAPFKVPRRIFFMVDFPKGPTGKIDRRALAQVCGASSAAAEPEVAPAPTAPSSIEAEVAALWRAVLDLPAINVDQDFFLTGGESLKAVQLFALVRDRFGVTLDLRHIFDEAATVAGMARLIEQARPEVGVRHRLPAGLVPIMSNGHRPPLFAVPGRDGDPGTFMNLGHVLDPEQPLYAFESRGLDGGCAPLDRIEDIAADHLAKIRAVQPRGPYYLTGMCFGGRVAYEMARQLEGTGESIGLLIMLDPSAPFTDAQGRPRGAAPVGTVVHQRTRLPRFVLRRMRMHARAMVRLRGKERIAYLHAKLGVLFGIVRQRDLFRGDRSELGMVAVREANRSAGRRYLPGPYFGPVVLCLTADDSAGGAADRRLDWLDRMPQAGVPHYVPGRDAGDMLNVPHVAVLAEHVDAWLVQAHAKMLDQQLERSGAPATD